MAMIIDPKVAIFYKDGGQSAYEEYKEYVFKNGSFNYLSRRVFCEKYKLSIDEMLKAVPLDIVH